MAINRESVVASAEKLVARGRIDGAIKEYRKLVADNPTDAMSLNRLGDLYVRVNKIEEAVRLFAQIADRYTQDGFFVKAIAIFKKIIKLDPTRLPIYERLAELYHKQGLVSEARTQYQVLVDYYLKHGKPDSAEKVLRQMTALDSGDPSPHVKLAELYRERGDHEREFLEYRQLAEMMLRHGRAEEASQVYARAVALAPNDLGFVTDAVLGLKDAGHVAAAAKLLALAVEKNPQAEKIARIAGLVRDRRGESPGAPARPGETQARVLRVSDVASVPPELRATRAGLSASGTATSRPTFEPAPPGEILSPIPSELDSFAAPEMGTVGERPPLAAGAADAELEFDLEIEGMEAEAPPPTAPAPGGAELDWSFEPEPALDLDFELPVVAPEAPPPAPPAGPEATPRPTDGFDLAELDRASFEVSRRAVSQARRLGDLLAEAEVFRKYGLREKAHDRAREILREDPQHAEALVLSAQLYVDDGRLDRALARGQELERLAAELPAAADGWNALRARFERLGFGFVDGRLSSAPPPKKAKKDSVSALLEEIAGVRAPARPAAPAKTAPTVDLQALVEGLRAVPQEPVVRRPATPVELPADLLPPPKPVRAPTARAAPEAPPAAPPPTPSPLPAPEVPPPADAHLEALEEAIDDRLAWLDEAAARAQKPAAAPAPTPSADALFEEEEGFFDLAAELEQELTQVEIATGQEVLPQREPSLEEIVEGFKKGVAESLSPEDYDTHFNLGIAYREMGLLDEAIGEFQLAAKHPRYLLDCCSLLGGCFLEKGLPELAIKWYQKGLATHDLNEDGRLGLLYDLGILFYQTGDADNARRTFVEIYGINSNYRDTVALLEELGAH